MKFWKQCTAGVLCLALAIGMGAALSGGSQSSSYTAAARMQVDINPSVEFILDSENKVLSVTALNDDGALIVAGEAFIGKTAEDAVALMVNVSTETGYLLKGDATADGETITISITGDADAAQALYESIYTDIQGILDESGINAAIERGEALRLEALKAMVLAADPTLSEEDADMMTEAQLLNALKVSRIETAQLLTEELREAYNTAKEYSFNFAERQATKDIIDGLGSAYQVLLSGYSAALDAYREAIQSLEQARYDYLVDPESDYQAKLAEVREQKDLVLAQRKEIAALSEGPAKEAAKAVLAAQETALTAKEAALTAAGNAANAAFDMASSAMKAVEKTLTDLESSFPEEITSALTENAQKVQDAMNRAKDEAFAAFEDAHKADIEKALADLEARKQALIDANAA